VRSDDISHQDMHTVTTARSHSDGYRPDIDGLRAVAVLAVVIFHAAPSLLPGGFIGVDIFFVISGFLISGIIFRQCERSTFSWVEFYARRVKRIFPALIVVLTFVLAFGWFQAIPDEFAQLGKHAFAGAAFFSNIALWFESGYFDGAAEFKPLLHLWSLGVEEQFYFVWPVLVPLVFRHMRRQLLPVIAALIAVSFADSLLWVRSDAAGAFFLPHTRLWELLCGGLLMAIAMRQPVVEAPPPAVRYDLAAGCGLAMLVLGMLFLNQDVAFPGWWAVVPVVATMAVIHGAERSRWVIKLLSHPALVGIGLISYPLYLWHAPLLTFLKTSDIGEANQATESAVVVLSFVLAWATYRFVERPVRLNTSWSSRQIAAPLVVGMVLVATAGSWIYAARGVPSRYPESMQSLLGSSGDAREHTEDAIAIGECFLNPQQGGHEFSPACLDPGRAESGSGAMLLWGDSHAAHLYPGLESLFRTRDFRLMRLTAAGCPPIVGYDVAGKPMCRSVNDHVQSIIDQERPETVMLAGNWMTQDPAALHATLEFLKSRSVRHVVLVGPVPQWTKPLHKIIVTEALRRDDHIAPRRVAHSLVAAVPEMDARMRASAAEEAVEYVSVWDALCNRLGCLARVGEGYDGIIALDREHLTPAGSVYLINLLFGPGSHFESPAASRKLQR
jgi:peptidoglycan/LPS O-acetylase OafA/YrhL